MIEQFLLKELRRRLREFGLSQVPFYCVLVLFPLPGILFFFFFPRLIFSFNFTPSSPPGLEKEFEW